MVNRRTQRIQASQTHLNPWKSDGMFHSGGYLYPYGQQEGDQEHGFTKGKSSLANLIAFYDETTT